MQECQKKLSYFMKIKFNKKNNNILLKTLSLSPVVFWSRYRNRNADSLAELKCTFHAARKKKNNNNRNQKKIITGQHSPSQVANCNFTFTQNVKILLLFLAFVHMFSAAAVMFCFCFLFSTFAGTDQRMWYVRI